MLVLISLIVVLKHIHVDAESQGLLGGLFASRAGWYPQRAQVPADDLAMAMGYVVCNPDSGVFL